MSTGPPEPYAAAHRLLSQLRVVARRMPGGLDAPSLAGSLIAAAARIAPFDQAGVLADGGGGGLVQLAGAGPDGAETTLCWDVDLGADTAIADAWVSQHPQRREGTMPQVGERPQAGSSLVVPLVTGARTFGVLALETSRAAAYPDTLLRSLTSVADETSLPLETALIFEEIRSVATTEERRRLAREIHDGIAQDIASIGYVLDGLAADAGDAGGTDLSKRIRALRGELSGVLREVRHSITALRTTVHEHGGLGAAVSDYARAAGVAAPFRVHLSLDEAPFRLPGGIEAELLRIAQEAISNARKHAGAANLWVTCTILPPSALLRVEDDGRGVQTSGRSDSYGLAIMKERATRLGASLVVQQRRPTGTLIEVRLGRRLAGGEQE